MSQSQIEMRQNLGVGWVLVHCGNKCNCINLWKTGSTNSKEGVAVWTRAVLVHSLVTRVIKSFELYMVLKADIFKKIMNNALKNYGVNV